MVTLNDALNNIFNGKNEYCCLCLKPVDEQAVHLQDEIVINHTQKEQEMSYILTAVLGQKILEKVSTYEAVCDPCLKQAVESYKFIETCNENTDLLYNTVNSISECLREVNLVQEDYNAIFLSLHSGVIFYDDKRKVKNTAGALKRLQGIIKQKTTKIEIEHEYDSIMDDCNIKSENDWSERKRSTKKPLYPINEIRRSKDSFTCKECYKNYSNAQSLRNHYMNVHVPKRFQCQKCPRSFTFKCMLETHLELGHSSAICTECGKTFSNIYSLQRHEWEHKKRIICQLCGRSYKNPSTYHAHIQANICQQKGRKSIKSGEYICDYCNKRYCLKKSLSMHIQFMHENGKSHICSWCGKKFRAQSCLTQHIVTHTQEKKFTCDICGGRFVSKESLLYHTRTHTGEKPYECHLCDAKFLSASRRSEHVKSRHMQMTYECDICHSTFKFRSGLGKHKKRHFNPKSRLHCV